MAFDLDDEELEATRKMHKSRYINVGSIEENIKILENLKSYLNLLVYEGKDKIIYNDLLWDEKTVDCINAIEHLINDYTRQKQINEEHQKINGELREKVKALEAENEATRKVIVEQCDFIQNFSIPKQKVKDKIKDLEYNSDLGFEKSLEEIFKIEVLEELLEENK